MGIARNIARLIPNGSGLLPNANIEAVAASKLTGQVPDANAPSGSVIQVVQFETSPTNISTGSTSYVNSAMLDVSITPQIANSKILIEFQGYIKHVNPQSDNFGGGTMIYRSIAGGSYNPVSSASYLLDGLYVNDQYAGAWQDNVGSSKFLDSPSYTLGQSITYQLWFKKSARGTGQWYVHHIGGLGTQAGLTRVIGIAKEISA